MVLQVGTCVHNVRSYIRYVGIRSPPEGNDCPYQGKHRLLFVHLSHGVYNADDNNTGKQVLQEMEGKRVYKEKIA